jgi:3-oxoacyl-[acyl-carrier protein] reductase
VNLGLEGRTALVVGAGSGLGHAVALALGREGARVAAAGRRAEPLEATAADIAAAGGIAAAVPLDLGDLDSLTRAVGEARETLGAIDILFLNGGGPPPTTALGQPSSLWESHFRTMVAGCIALADAIVPGMRDRGFGRVITNASSGVVAPIPNLAISNALRLALVGWSKTLAAEVAAHGVTVNVVLPGRIATGRIDHLDRARAEREGSTQEAVARASTGSIPAGRYGEPEEYAAAVAFLAGAPASYITGSVIRVDGGFIPSI